MRKLAVLAVLLLIVPSAFALILEKQQIPMISNVVTQGYEYAIVQGFNKHSSPITITHWHMNAELGTRYTFCELQPITVQPGPFTADIVVSCLSRTSMATFFPINTIVNMETYVPEGTPPNSILLDSIKLETRVQKPVPFPVTEITGEAVSGQEGTGEGSFIFFAGMGAIALLTMAIILASRKAE